MSEEAWREFKIGRPRHATPAHGRHERRQKPGFRRNQASNTAYPKERARGDQRYGARACLIHTIVTCGDECPKCAMEARRQHRIKRTLSKTCRSAKQFGCQQVGTVEWSAAKNGAESMGQVPLPK